MCALLLFPVKYIKDGMMKIFQGLVALDFYNSGSSPVSLDKFFTHRAAYYETIKSIADF
jgi:hypothetical protein